MSPEVHLRSVEDTDLDAFFEHQADPVSVAMAAFPARDRDHFTAHWAKVRADPNNISRTIVADGAVAGHVACWPGDGEQMIGYWVGREWWGRGVATRALALLLDDVPIRPLHAYVVAHNAGSIRVLEKCGFQRDGAHLGEDGVEELIFVLDA